METFRTLVLIAQGVSTTELIPPVDMLRRVNIEVTIASVEGTQAVKTDSDVLIVPDSSLEDALKKGPYHVIIIPGSEESAYKVGQNQQAKQFVLEHAANNKIVGALGAGCLTLIEFGAGKGKELAASPFFLEVMQGEDKNKEWIFVSDETVVIDDNFITSQGMWTAMDFSFDLIEKVLSKTAADEMAAFVIHIRHAENGKKC